MYILGVGTAAPERVYSQKDCWEAFQASAIFGELTPRSRALLRRVLTSSNGIERRHLSVDNLAEGFDITPDRLIARFAEHAPRLATSAALRALEKAELEAGAIDALLVSTCTGYLCPGLTSYVSELLGLRPTALLLDLVGQGCGAAIPNLRTADALLASGNYQRVLSVCVEVCSAAAYVDNDPGVLISACIFGDGAGAAVLSADAHGTGRRVKWCGADTLLSATDRDMLKFEQRAGMLRNVLLPQVPATAADYVARVLSNRLSRNGVRRGDINTWLFHPGGRDVLAAICQRLELGDHDVRFSADVLRDYGNMSSPSVFFVLERALQQNVPGGCWWMSSFGAGFSCHGALLEVE